MVWRVAGWLFPVVIMGNLVFDVFSSAPLTRLAVFEIALNVAGLVVIFISMEIGWILSEASQMMEKIFDVVKESHDRR